MELIMIAVAWIMTNYESLLAIAFAIEVVAIQIVNLTPTEVDNRFLAKARKVLVFIANIVPNAKDTPKG